ncbi:unnamed protein product [Lampetra planeri]
MAQPRAKTPPPLVLLLGTALCLSVALLGRPCAAGFMDHLSKTKFCADKECTLEELRASVEPRLRVKMCVIVDVNTNKGRTRTCEPCTLVLVALTHDASTAAHLPILLLSFFF